MNAPRLLLVGLITGCRANLAIDRIGRVAVAAAVIGRGAAAAVPEAADNE